MYSDVDEWKETTFRVVPFGVVSGDSKRPKKSDPNDDIGVESGGEKLCGDPEEVSIVVSIPGVFGHIFSGKKSSPSG